MREHSAAADRRSARPIRRSNCRRGDSPNTGTRFGKFLQPAAAATHRREARRRGAGARAHRRVPDGRAARAVGSSARARGRAERCWRAAAAARRAAGRDQPEPLPGPGLQVRLVRQSGRGHPSARRSITASTASQIARALGSPRPVALVRRRLQLSGHGGHPRSASAGSPRDSRRCTRVARSGPAAAGRVQAVRAGVLPHRHRRLGHGAAAGARRRTAGEGAGRHRPSLPVAEHRADRRVAARRRHARRLPLQRSPLCRRRPDARLDRSVPGVPHLPRDPVLRVADRARAPTSPT